MANRGLKVAGVAGMGCASSFFVLTALLGGMLAECGSCVSREARHPSPNDTIGMSTWNELGLGAVGDTSAGLGLGLLVLGVLGAAACIAGIVYITTHKDAPAQPAPQPPPPTEPAP